MSSTLWSFTENATAVTSVLAGDQPIVYRSGVPTLVSNTGVLASGGVVDTTATALTITQALHSGRQITISAAAPIAITLPAATGTGSRYRFQVQVVATATSHTIKVANTTDVMQGIVCALTTSSANVIGYGTTSTSDTISVNGTTTGGVVGDWFEIIDVKSGFFSVSGMTSPTGSTATPFSATV